jgi:outer membrane protein assembly factor BamB
MKSEHGLVAVKPGGTGDVGKTHVVWKHKQSVPEVSSPLYYQGQVYMVREGGIVTCLNAATGQVHYKERLGAEGAYFASPVAGDGKVYTCSYAGVVSVLAAGPKYQVLAQHDLGEHIMATPALVEGHIYLRTATQLYAFGK